MVSRRYLIAVFSIIPLLTFCATSFAQFGQVHLDLDSPVWAKQGLPGTCSTWHELYPTYCVMHHQTGFDDNGDGELSECDFIYLDGASYHVEKVCPTYYLDCGVFEPEGEPQPGDPICQVWHMVHPDYCFSFHVVGWEDGDHNGEVSACDMIWLEGMPSPCHVIEVGLDIIVVPGGSPAEKGAWGKIKAFFVQILE